MVMEIRCADLGFRGGGGGDWVSGRVPVCRSVIGHHKVLHDATGCHSNTHHIISRASEYHRALQMLNRSRSARSVRTDRAVAALQP